MVLPAPRKPVNTVTGVVSAMGVAVQRVGRDLRRSDFDQGAVEGGSVEAVAAAGVAGDAVLVDQQQQRVAVAIDAELLQVLGLAGGFALSPQPAAAAAEVADPAGCQGLPNRIRRSSRPSSAPRRCRAAARWRDQAVGVEADRRQHGIGLDRGGRGSGLGGNFVHE